MGTKLKSSLVFTNTVAVPAPASKSGVRLVTRDNAATYYAIKIAQWYSYQYLFYIISVIFLK